jgi:N-acetylmuramoyl-L-alanine amidase
MGLPIWGVLSLSALLAGCSAEHQGSRLASAWDPSPNFGVRRPNFVILHHTGDDSASESISTLTDPRLQVSAHYLIEKNGRIVQLVDERLRAWHAGVASWGSVDDLNSVSIGIELDNNGAQPYPEPQIAALLELLADLHERYKIPRQNVLGHADVAPRRKVDPGRLFPWRRLAQAGFGLWCDPPYPGAPPGFDGLLGLRAFGYDTRDPEAALASFRLHFEPDGGGQKETQDERDQLFCLLGASLPSPVREENESR